jgi:hypothetical protein
VLEYLLDLKHRGCVVNLDGPGSAGHRRFLQARCAQPGSTGESQLAFVAALM